MNIITDVDLRKNLADAFDKINENHSPILITRKNGEHAVLMSLKDYNTMIETVYLLGNAKNAQRLHQSFKNAKTHKMVKKLNNELIESIFTTR